MKRLLIELEDVLVAIRNAVRRALWQLEEHATAKAYRKQPDSVTDIYLEARAWDTRSNARRATRSTGPSSRS
jgi:hypothetical protein